MGMLDLSTLVSNLSRNDFDGVDLSEHTPDPRIVGEWLVTGQSPTRQETIELIRKHLGTSGRHVDMSKWDQAATTVSITDTEIKIGVESESGARQLGTTSRYVVVGDTIHLKHGGAARLIETVLDVYPNRFEYRFNGPDLVLKSEPMPVFGGQSVAFVLSPPE